MGPAFSLPRLVFGLGSLARLAEELALLGVERPLLLSDRGIERAGLLAGVLDTAASFLDVPENPTANGADAAAAAYREAHCDGMIALGGGSVIDTAKIVAALAIAGTAQASDLIGRPERICAVAPLIAVPTTVGTGSESSPVAALHLTDGSAVGTRSHLLVPKVAICDPQLTRTLPRKLIAATAIDALSHCIEGYFAAPPNPVADALALDGVARVFADVHAALAPAGEDARASLMAAAFAGGVAIQKGLGPAHAIALSCGDQDVHHGTLIGVALPFTTRLLAAHVPDKAARLRTAIGVAPGADLGEALAQLVATLGLPGNLADAGYRIDDAARLADDMARSHFNRTSPYAPTRDEYRRLLSEIAA